MTIIIKGSATVACQLHSLGLKEKNYIKTKKSGEKKLIKMKAIPVYQCTVRKRAIASSITGLYIIK